MSWFFPQDLQAVVDVKNVALRIQLGAGLTGTNRVTFTCTNDFVERSNEKLPLYWKKLKIVQGHPTWLLFKKQLAINKLESSFLLRAYSMIPAFHCALFFHPSWEKPVRTSAAIVGNQLSVSVLTREKSTNHCQTWTWLTCQTFFEMLKIPTLLTKTWETLKTPKSEIEVRKTSFFLPNSPPFDFQPFRCSTVESTVESSRKNRALHFIRSVGEAATSENSQSGNPVRLPPPAGICVYRVYIYIYIYCIYGHTTWEYNKNIYIIYIYISDIRFLLLAATSANLQSCICCLFFQSFHAQKIGSRSLWHPENLIMTK